MAIGQRERAPVSDPWVRLLGDAFAKRFGCEREPAGDGFARRRGANPGVRFAKPCWCAWRGGERQACLWLLGLSGRVAVGSAAPYCRRAKFGQRRGAGGILRCNLKKRRQTLLRGNGMGAAVPWGTSPRDQPMLLIDNGCGGRIRIKPKGDYHGPECEPKHLHRANCQRLNSMP
jgi:hypothetical protein